MTPDDLYKLATFAAGPIASVALLGWWLRGQFNHISSKTYQLLDAHEKQDERRHRQNLVRFAKLNMKLGIHDPNDDNGEGD